MASRHKLYGNRISYVNILYEFQIVEKEIVFGDKNRKIEIRRLKEFQRYEFWVAASTVVGEGQPSFRVNQSPSSRGKDMNGMFMAGKFHD